MIKKEKNRQTELKEFLEIDTHGFNLSRSFFTRLKQRLFPNPWTVFGKVFLIHAFVGSLSLSVCSQFGIDPFGTTFSLSDLLTRVGGQAFCMNMCGVLFMASTYLFSNLFLTLEELESVKNRKWLQTGVLGLVSLAAFYFFGAQLIATFVILWLIGVMIGGVLSVELSYHFRQSRAGVR